MQMSYNRRRLTRSLVAVCAVAFVVAVLLISSSPFQIRYHEWQMQRAWDAMWAQPDVQHRNLVGKVLGDDYERYAYHRQQLVRLGAVRELHYKFDHVLIPSDEGRHFHKRLVARDCPPCIDFEADWRGIPQPMTLTVWCYANDAETWDRFVAKHDVPDYSARFVGPD